MVRQPGGTQAIYNAHMNELDQSLDGNGGVEQVCGTVHYLKPDGSSLLARNLFSLEQVRAAGLYRTEPERYKDLLVEGYIRGVPEDRPAVIQLNCLKYNSGIHL